MWLALSACEPDAGRPSPEYAAVDVPEKVLASDAAKARGRAIFAERCALCHGVRADGKGVRKHGLSGQPTNFRSPAWRADTTPREVFAAVSEGIRGTSMPGWPTLTEDERWDVVAYVLSVSKEGR